jgi:peptide methionine sulfoxide reductase msrA/msrB
MNRAACLTALLLVIAAVVATFQTPSQADETKKGKPTVDYQPLTSEEERVIVKKGTEKAFTGEYWDHHDDGTYRCRRCRNPLFSSDSKFDSGTGWPSFDKAIEGAVKEVPDPDGIRTEIVCATCGAHLGHVFKGESFTAENTRHCVNSASLCFMPQNAPPEDAYFAGGCFWGVEYWFEKVDGVISAESGYMGGDVDNPEYKHVSSGSTGHAETVKVRYDPTVVSYEKLARLFFEIHDPTQMNRQGPDVGTQYRSAVFYNSEEQKKEAERLIKILRDKGHDVVTEVEPAGTFWTAEEYHQDYYELKGSLPYCHAKVDRFGG